MMGLLEHVRGVAGIKKRTLNVLWATLNSSAEGTTADAQADANAHADAKADTEPCELIKPQGAAIAALAHIESSLLASPCVSLLTFVKPDDVYSHESSLDEYRFQSDAAVEPDVDYVKMGGVYYGFYWYLALQAPLSVPVAELMAIGIEVLDRPRPRGCSAISLCASPSWTPSARARTRGVMWGHFQLD